MCRKIADQCIFIRNSYSSTIIMGIPNFEIELLQTDKEKQSACE